MWPIPNETFGKYFLLARTSCLLPPISYAPDLLPNDTRDCSSLIAEVTEVKWIRATTPKSSHYLTSILMHLKRIPQ